MDFGYKGAVSRDRATHHKHWGHKLLALAAIASLGATFAACGASAGSYCSQARVCEGGVQADENACNDVEDEGQKLADLKNCQNEWDNYASCRYENARCDNHVYAPDQKICQTQADQWTQCLGSVQ